MISGLEDGEIGEPLKIRISSEKEPDDVFDGQHLQFEKTGEKEYTATIIPDSTGFPLHFRICSGSKCAFRIQGTR